MARWVPFVGLTAVVLTLLLGLARLSQGMVSDGQPQLPSGSDSEADSDTPTRTDSPGPEPVAEQPNARTPYEDCSADGDRDDSDESSATPGEIHISDRIDTTPGAKAGTSLESGAGPTDEAATGNTADVSVGPPPTATTETQDRASTADSTRRTDPRGRAQQRRRRDLTTGALLANVAVTQGLFGGIVLAGALFYGIPGTALGVTAHPWSTGLPALALGVGFGLLLWGANEVSAAVADAVGAAYDEGLREMLAPDSTGGWLVLLGLVLPLIALVEEFLFRAALIGVPAAGFGISPWALAIVSSTAFAFGHGAQGRVGIAVTGGLGFVLAAGFILSGSLLVVVVAHYLVNAMEFLIHEGLSLDRPNL